MRLVYVKKFIFYGSLGFCLSCGSGVDAQVGPDKRPPTSNTASTNVTHKTTNTTPRISRSTPLQAVPVKSDGSKDFPKVGKEYVSEGVHYIAKFGLYVYVSSLEGFEIFIWKVDGPAASAGLQKDDWITKVNDVDLSTTADDITIKKLIAVLKQSGNKPAKIVIERVDGNKDNNKDKEFMVKPRP